MWRNEYLQVNSLNYATKHMRTSFFRAMLMLRKLSMTQSSTDQPLKININVFSWEYLCAMLLCKQLYSCLMQSTTIAHRVIPWNNWSWTNAMSQVHVGSTRNEINMLIRPVGGQITRKKYDAWSLRRLRFQKMLDLPPHRHTNVSWTAIFFSNIHHLQMMPLIWFKWTQRDHPVQ